MKRLERLLSWYYNDFVSCSKREKDRRYLYFHSAAREISREVNKLYGVYRPANIESLEKAKELCSYYGIIL